MYLVQRKSSDSLSVIMSTKCQLHRHKPLEYIE